MYNSKKTDREIEMRKLKRQGVPYKDIAKIYEISYQRVGQILREPDKRYFRPVSETVIAPAGLRNWMNTNRISVSALTQRVYGYYHPAVYKRMRQALNTPFVPIDLVKKLIKITNLTFEELFMEEENNGNSNN